MITTNPRHCAKAGLFLQSAEAGNRLPDKGNAKFSRIEKDMNRKFEDVLERIPAEKRGMVIEALKLYNEALETDEPAN